MRTALTGAGGLIGHAIAEILTAAGHEIVRIGRRDDDDIFLNLATPSSLDENSLAGCNALVHAAGVTDEDFSDRDAAFRKAIHGASVLLAAAKAAGISRLVYVSSAHVYGPLEGRIDETHPVNPLSDYAIAHFVTEQLFRRASLHPSSSTLLLRPCAVFGLPPSLERFARWSLVPYDLPRQALSGRITLKSRGEQRRNFVSAECIAAFVAEWLTSPANGVSVANVPGRDEMSIYDFALLCAKICKEEVEMSPPIERPDSSNSGPHQPLEYRSYRKSYIAGPNLEDHARLLIRILARGIAR
jgi:UDP-glucose 4-epimerase